MQRIKDELINIGKFSLIKIINIETIHHINHQDLYDSCYTTKDNKYICLENNRLQSDISQ